MYTVQSGTSHSSLLRLLMWNPSMKSPAALVMLDSISQPYPSSAAVKYRLLNSGSGRVMKGESLSSPGKVMNMEADAAIQSSFVIAFL